MKNRKGRYRDFRRLTMPPIPLIWTSIHLVKHEKYHQGVEEMIGETMPIWGVLLQGASSTAGACA